MLLNINLLLYYSSRPFFSLRLMLKLINLETNRSSKRKNRNSILYKKKYIRLIKKNRKIFLLNKANN